MPDQEYDENRDATYADAVLPSLITDIYQSSMNSKNKITSFR